MKKLFVSRISQMKHNKKKKNDKRIEIKISAIS